MKTRTIIIGVLIILAMTLAVMSSLSGPRPEILDVEPEPPPTLEELIPQGFRIDRRMTIRVLIGEEIEVMTMERYLICVVAAEMPATFEQEALMAQAVAARTNAFYNMNVEPKPNHPDADVCTDFSCCTAYSDDDLLRDRWRGNYVEYIARIINAVLKTDGEYIQYDGKPIQAFFHSSSAGKTETSGNVWMTDLPYLISVNSPETAESVPNYITSVTVPRSDFIETVQFNYPDAVFSGNDGSWITSIMHTESGRIYELVIGGVAVKGTALRSMFDLRSTAISIRWVDGDIVFTTTGFGHGVGMSQYGANEMAKSGMDYKEILSTYYTGTTVINDN